MRYWLSFWHWWSDVVPSQLAVDNVQRAACLYFAVFVLLVCVVIFKAATWPEGKTGQGEQVFLWCLASFGWGFFAGYFLLKWSWLYFRYCVRSVFWIEDAPRKGRRIDAIGKVVGEPLRRQVRASYTEWS